MPSSLGGWEGKSKEDVERETQECKFKCPRSSGKRGLKRNRFALPFKYFTSSQGSAPRLPLTVWKDELSTHRIHEWLLQIALP